MVVCRVWLSSYLGGCLGKWGCARWAGHILGSWGLLWDVNVVSCLVGRFRRIDGGKSPTWTDSAGL